MSGFRASEIPRWMQLLMQSVERVRAVYADSQADPVEIDRNDLVHLVNRAESLVMWLERTGIAERAGLTPEAGQS